MKLPYHDKTRDGCNAVVERIDGPGEFPVRGYVIMPDGHSLPLRWRAGGRYNRRGASHLDLMNFPPVDDTPEQPPVPQEPAPPLGPPITMTYRNYRGEVGRRSVIPIRLWWGTTEWHPEPGWLMEAYDLEKAARRDFALADADFRQVDGSAAPAIEPESDK